MNHEKINFLEGLLNKTLHITLADQRLITGSFRCCDNTPNVILSNAFEYKMPSAREAARAVAQGKDTGRPAKADMTSRFVRCPFEGYVTDRL